MTDVPMTAVSLFAGVGGFDLALERAGAQVVAAVEIDNSARGVLARRFPNSTLFSDVCEVTSDQLLRAGFIPERGVLVGGFPCQDLSVAGRRAGLEGKRSGLFWEIVRLVDELRPRWLVLENVPGLLSSNGGRDMGTVVRALEERGYSVGWRVLDAQFFGVAQRRRRVFLVCHSGDERTAPLEILFEREGGGGDSSSSLEPREDSSGSFTTSARGGRIFDDNDERPVLLRMRSGKDGGGKGALLSEDVSLTLQTGNDQTVFVPTRTISAEEVKQRQATPLLGSDIVGALCASGYKFPQNQQVGENKVIVQSFPIQDGRGIEKSQNGLGVGAEGDPAYTLDTLATQAVVAVPIQGTVIGRADTSGPQGRGHGNEGGPMFTLETIAPHGVAVWRKSRRAQSVDDFETWVEDDAANTLNVFENTSDTRATSIITAESSSLADFAVVRRLTPTECERLQGFPDGWTSERVDFKTNEVVEQKDAPRYKQMGNAVAVPVVEWICRRIVAFEDGTL